MLCAPALAATYSYRILGDDPGGWPALLSSIGLVKGAGDVVIAPAGTPASTDWAARVDRGTILVLEGESPLAASFGFRATEKHVTVRSVEDLRARKLRIVWEQALDVPVFELPSATQVFARERRQKTPLMAGFRRGGGAVLWLAAPPGPHGYDRFPYLPQALAELGLAPVLRSQNVWAFFDSSYRARVDLDYFAVKWRNAGIAALHVAAWHYWERDAQADDYLRRLIQACHRNGILVYAWIEFPHVSERFWSEHPEWREKTALGQDAQLDWRKLINLSNPDAFHAVSAGLVKLMEQFDWDGLNLAELYFESLEGHENPARFTPMNQDVRTAFRASAGFDPRDLFDPASPLRFAESPTGLRQFLDFRADLARRLQEQWIAQAEEIRKSKSHLDLVLTHVDDRFDSSMRDKIGADASRVLPLLSSHDFTFLIEDPATIWNLGPQRYSQIAARYKPLTPRQEKLGIDINVAERYQDVYPTKLQTGAELFQLVHQAAQVFPRVMLYFESSIAPIDLPLLPAAAATVNRLEAGAKTLVVESNHAVGLDWKGPALVNGRSWPVAGDATLWLPAGLHSIEPSLTPAPLRLTSLNAELQSASATTAGLEFSYRSSSRALATLDHPPRRIEIDGVEVQPQFEGDVLFLPRGQHLVTIER